MIYRSAFFGLFLFITGATFQIYLHYLHSKASRIDGGSELKAGGACLHSISGIDFSGSNVIAVSDSRVLKVMLSNDGAWLSMAKAFAGAVDPKKLKELEESDGSCDADVHISAPTFKISPKNDEQTIHVPVGENAASAVWVLAPLKIGTQEVYISSGDSARTLGISVTNNFGMPIIITNITSIFLSFFGPALTLPWLYEKWKGRKKKNDV